MVFAQKHDANINIPKLFVNRVVECVSPVSCSTVVNGKLGKPFLANKGIKQGDPLFPFLFAIVMDYLSILLDDFASKSEFQFH